VRVISGRTGVPALLAILAVSSPASLVAQQPQGSPNPILVEGVTPPPAPVTGKGPEVKGIIAARNDDKIKITTADGSDTVIAINEATRVSKSGGLFQLARTKLGAASLLNGLPVTVKTMQSADGLVASQIVFRNTDLRTASMIRTGTAQQFGEQTAATQALRGRMGDIDKYDIKGTTSVNFDTGRAVLSAQAKQELCAAATAAEATDNALMLVVGYTDSTGSEDYNQQLSEKRAASVINYLQQTCRWKPYRMLTPTGMSEADPMASNDTVEGKAQNRRVSVNILVSKAVDGL
jgi:OmpA-OmpF porin, OOP family